MTPNKERLRLWVAALRSGEYKQCQGINIWERPSGNQYCCLGVACEVAEKNGFDGYPGWRLGVSLGFAAEWYGIMPDPTIGEVHPGEPHKVLTAIRANDGLGWSFDRIADAIETYYELKEKTE